MPRHERIGHVGGGQGEQLADVARIEGGHVMSPVELSTQCGSATRPLTALARALHVMRPRRLPESVPAARPEPRHIAR